MKDISFNASTLKHDCKRCGKAGFESVFSAVAHLKHCKGPAGLMAEHEKLQEKAAAALPANPAASSAAETGPMSSAAPAAGAGESAAGVRGEEPVVGTVAGAPMERPSKEGPTLEAAWNAVQGMSRALAAVNERVDQIGRVQINHLQHIAPSSGPVPAQTSVGPESLTEFLRQKPLIAFGAGLVLGLGLAWLYSERDDGRDNKTGQSNGSGVSGPNMADNGARRAATVFGRKLVGKAVDRGASEAVKGLAALVRS